MVVSPALRKFYDMRSASKVFDQMSERKSSSGLLVVSCFTRTPNHLLSHSVQHNNKSESVYGSSSQSAEIAGKYVDYDMNLTYLQMSFLGISNESLSGVYATNKGDMKTTLDMLHQLE
nr:hypothetical protein [Tanacetum cinerariifolium]